MPQLTMKQIFGDSVELDINPLEGIGARTGQIQRIANVNLFQDTEINNLPDIDSL